MIPETIYRVVIVEEDDLIRDSLYSLINETDNFLCIAGYDNIEDLIRNIKNDQPKIILLDIDISAIEGIKKIKKVYPPAEIIVLTLNNANEKVFNALCAGAVGYLTKNIPVQNIVDSMNEILKGGAPMSTEIARMITQTFRDDPESLLTSKEADILRFLSRGKSYTTIADELHTSKDKIYNHIKNIYQKLNSLS